MDRLVRALIRFEAQHPNGYTWREACQALGWPREKFQRVLRVHRHRQGFDVTNTPALPLHGGNRLFTYINTGVDQQNEIGEMRELMFCIARLENARAFANTRANAAAQATGWRSPSAMRARRMVRRITFVLEELRDTG